MIEVRGQPLLGYAIERIRQVPDLDRIVLATSDRALDSSLETFARSMAVECYRGPVDDVAGRVLKCAMHFELDNFVRVNGDSPLIDFEAIRLAIETFRHSEADVVTNVFPRSFPIGASVEIVRTSALARAYAEMQEMSHLEHVTKFFYDHPASFSIINIDSGDPTLSDMNLAVDTPEDLERFKHLVSVMEGGHLKYTGAELYALCRQLFVELTRK